MISNQLKRFACAIGVSICCLSTVFATEPDVDPTLELKINIQKACPKQWEDLFSNIELNPNVLDIWQGDLTDKAQFVQYANEFLLDDNGSLLIDNYHDAITIMSECAAQRVTYYKAVRQQIGTRVSGMVNALTGQTAFGRNSIAGGVDYSDWVEGTTIEEDFSPAFAQVNLAFGRATAQSGTTSEELALLEKNQDPDVEYTDEEYGEMAERSGYAVNAVDNNTDGSLSGGSVTYTGFQNEPFWQVELDDVRTLKSIVIYNRTDADHKERLNDFYIMISESPISERSIAEAIQGVHVVGGGPQAYFEQDSKVFNLPDLIKGQYIRIQLAGNDTVLSLAEVKVFGFEQDEAAQKDLEDTLLKTIEQ